QHGWSPPRTGPGRRWRRPTGLRSQYRTNLMVLHSGLSPRSPSGRGGGPVSRSSRPNEARNARRPARNGPASSDASAARRRPRSLRQALLQLVELLAHAGREALAEGGVVLLDQRDLLPPRLVVDLQELGHGGGVDVQTRGVQAL